MADNRGPWYKEDGQQDKGLTKDDLLAGRRLSTTPKKDPRFPDYYKRPVGERDREILVFTRLVWYWYLMLSCLQLRLSRILSFTPNFDILLPIPSVPVQRSHSTTALDNHLKARLLSTRRSEGNLRQLNNTSSSSTMPDRYRKLIRTPEDFVSP